MPEAKFDNRIGCNDYNLMGENCPFYSGGQCHILGRGTPMPMPGDGVCDKSEGGPITKATALLFDLDDSYLGDEHGSDAYRRFREAVDHYSMPEGVRSRIELEALYKKVRGQANMSKRTFMKQFKPNNVGVTEGEAPSFRLRVLNFLRGVTRLQHSFRSRNSVPSEKVALRPYIERERYLEDGNEEVEEYLTVEIYTRNTCLREEIDMGGLGCWDGFEALCRQHIDQKILVQVDFYYSPGSYEYPGDVDFGITNIQVLQVIT